MIYSFTKCVLVHSSISALSNVCRYSFQLVWVVQSPIHTEIPHYHCKEGLPLHLLCLFTLKHKAASVSVHTARQCCWNEKGTAIHILTLRSVLVFINMLPWFPPFNINMFNHMDAVMMCCDGDSDLPCIVESDKVKFCALSDITQSPSVIIPPCKEVHCSLGWYGWLLQWFF